MSKESVTVYWSPFSPINRQMNLTLLDLEPVPIYPEIIQRRDPNPIIPNSGRQLNSNGYQSCSAWHTLGKNYYSIPSPFDAHIKLNSNGEILPSPHYEWFIERVSSMKNSLSLDVDLEYSFFCEEPLNITLTPPFMHKPSQSDYGFLIPARFDISSWFRPVVLIHQLWENVSEFKVSNGEPLAYIKFETDKKVVLKRFQMTQDIKDIADACLNYKYVRSFEPLDKLYKRFHKVGFHKKLSNEIKKNLF